MALAIISLVCGIVSWFIFWWLSIVGLITGIIQLCLPEKTTAHIVMSIIGIILNGIALLVVIF